MDSDDIPTFTVDELFEDRITGRLLPYALKIWEGERQESLAEFAIVLQVVVGNLARAARHEIEGRPDEREKVRRYLGNLMLTSARACHALGFDPDMAVADAVVAQLQYVEDRRAGA